VSGFIELNGSPAYIASLAQGFFSDAQRLTEGIESFRASVSDLSCLGDDRIGEQLRACAPSSSDIDLNCKTQSSCAESDELLGHGLVDSIAMVDDVVDQGKKNVDGTKRTS
jgi:hypothetical protein